MKKSYTIGPKKFLNSKKPDVREQLITYGAAYVSDQELIMLLLGNGTSKVSLTTLSKNVLTVIKNTDSENLLSKLLLIKGIGKGKASVITAALECGRRMSFKPGLKITKPADIVPYVQTYAIEQQEHFICISLTGAHELIKVKVVCIGILNKAIIHPREVFTDPLKDRAAAIILVHNHPSGNVNPSKEDIEATKRIKDASQLIGVQLLDHLIITRTEYYSFLENTDLFTK